MDFVGYKADGVLAGRIKEEVESGMGYQIIDAGSSGEYYVFNSEYLVPYAQYANFRSFIAENFEVSFDEIFTKEFKTDFEKINLMDKESNPEAIVARKTKSNEIFFRLSAFPNDHRVLNGIVQKGTYATTVTDIDMVPNGFAAVGRYALPNPASAKYVNVILPPENTDIVVCTVKPAYNQAGGGVEVYFPKGCKFNYHSFLISES